MQFKPVRVTGLCNYNPSACNCQLKHVQMKHFLAHLQDLIPTSAGLKH